MIKSYSIFVFLLIFFNSGPANSAGHKINVDSIALQVLQKGLVTNDLGLYPGILLMHGMSELAEHLNEQDLIRRAVSIFQKYDTKEIQGRGSYICYETGGSGAAYLLFKGKGSDLSGQVSDGAVRMMKQQKRSTEGLMIPPNKTENQVFIDMAFAVTPYLLYAGLAENRTDYIDFAVFETLELFRILEDTKTGLVHQGRGFQGTDVISQDNWSRGNGWGAFALSILVRDLPDNHPKKPEINALAIKFFKAVLKFQDQTGLWHQEMTDQDSYIETSGSGLLLFGLGIMVEKNLLGKQYRKNLVKGLESYLAYIGDDGSVSNTCIGCLCPGKGTKEDYKSREWALNDPHAFGPVVLAFAQASRLGIGQLKLSGKKAAF